VQSAQRIEAGRSAATKRRAAYGHSLPQVQKNQVGADRKIDPTALNCRIDEYRRVSIQNLIFQGQLSSHQTVRFEPPSARSCH